MKSLYKYILKTNKILKIETQKKLKSAYKQIVQIDTLQVRKRLSDVKRGTKIKELKFGKMLSQLN